MKNYIFTLLLLCTASIAYADRIVRYIETPDYDQQEVYEYTPRMCYYQRPIVKKTVYYKPKTRVIYKRRPIVIRPAVNRVRIAEHSTSPFVSGLIGFGLGTILGNALSK